MGSPKNEWIWKASPYSLLLRLNFQKRMKERIIYADLSFVMVKLFPARLPFETTDILLGTSLVFIFNFIIFITVVIQ